MKASPYRLRKTLHLQILDLARKCPIGREFHDQPVSGTGELVPPLIGGEEALETLSVEGDQAYNVDLPDWLSEDLG